MQQKYACVRYLHTRITVYQACKIDLRYCKALHSCVTCRLLHAVGLSCAAIHYGLCTAVAAPALDLQVDSSSKGKVASSAAQRLAPPQARKTTTAATTTAVFPAPVASLPDGGEMAAGGSGGGGGKVGTFGRTVPPTVLPTRVATAPQPPALPSGAAAERKLAAPAEVVMVVVPRAGVKAPPDPLAEVDGEPCPAFPVSPEDQLAVPNGSQRGDTPHHGVLREKEAQPRERDLPSDLPFKDSRSLPRFMPAISSSPPPVIPVISSKSTTSLAKMEDKENKPKVRDLPVPRVPPTQREDVPQFFFPMGKPQVSLDMDALMQRVSAEFATMDGGRAYKEQMGRLAKACGLPVYWKILLYRAAGGDKQGYVTLQTFSAMLKKLLLSCHDEASRFLRLMVKPGQSVLEFEDFIPLVQDVVDSHPGLSFLQDAPEFHSRYIHTVISRIFFCVNRSWTGRITLPELRKSNFLQVLSILEEEEDINQVTEYFSYEHFYVIYCKFWELDKDHDLYIDKSDLARHNDHALNSRIIDRIFSGAVTRGKDFQDGRMSYKEFVWFLISEEDKNHPTSIEYWFRCMDLDGDGVISMYEMEYFYQEQMQKMEALGIEKLPFEDCLCQMYDLVRPREPEKITLGDLKNCRMANIFFDTFFNLDKFLEHEQRDPFTNARDLDAAGNEMSDWDRYAAEEYDILVAEEGINEQEEIHYEDDFEPDDDEAVQEELARLADPPQRKVTPRLHPVSNDDMYDFGSTSLGF